MNDHFHIPPHLRRPTTRTLAEANRLQEEREKQDRARRMKYPNPKPAKKPKRFSVDPGSAKTLLTFGWSATEIKKISSRRELDDALDSITNPATWRTK
jgi:hypothetical protein